MTKHTTQLLPYKKQTGFSLIEMLVSLALFTIVSVVTVGALLTVIGGNQRLTEQQTDLSAAAFAFDNMTREIRTGFRYVCDNNRSTANQPSVASSTNCISGASGISLVEAATGRQVSGGTGRISYYFQDGTLYRRLGNNSPEQLLPSDVVVDPQSRFFVTNTTPLLSGSNTQQPLVTIVMTLAATPERQAVTFQTTIAQRALDL
jgi:prepilin-type N-terminal cleavage/methylation domain-containing protein